ncbi:CPBP family intramembrane glutamic endopeptidase [Aurantiacibacter suaedae]|uniref:CPBP family intramembrane glutamic endopeptidase n=1 Tax=Aurantiacibacter suaedae TaxID=2545755 RepID=UPI0010F88841|nr:CPBP family intramembrane glutamic endopeptidase [Aurantiacibacter suaedae]
MTTRPSPLRLLLHIVLVALAYVAASTVPVLALGQTSAGLALSSPAGMLGGVGAAWLILRRPGTFATALGLIQVASWPRTLALAALAAGGTFAIFSVDGAALRLVGLPSPAVGETIALATQSPAHLAMWIVLVAWLGAGFGEEVLWRGFLIDRLARLPALARSPMAVLVVQAAVFGLAHAYQGAAGVVITGLIGLWFGLIRHVAGGAIWAGAIGHAAVDTVMLSLGYAQETGLIGP